MDSFDGREGEKTMSITFPMFELTPFQVCEALVQLGHLYLLNSSAAVLPVAVAGELRVPGFEDSSRFLYRFRLDQRLMPFLF